MRVPTRKGFPASATLGSHVRLRRLGAFATISASSSRRGRDAASTACVVVPRRVAAWQDELSVRFRATGQTRPRDAWPVQRRGTPGGRGRAGQARCVGAPHGEPSFGPPHAPQVRLQRDWLRSLRCPSPRLARLHTAPRSARFVRLFPCQAHASRARRAELRRLSHSPLEKTLRHALCRSHGLR